MGCEVNYLLPAHVKLLGHCAASLLAMDFTKISHSEDAYSLGVPSGPFRLSQKNERNLSPNVELGLGVGLPAARKNIDIS